MFFLFLLPLHRRYLCVNKCRSSRQFGWRIAVSVSSSAAAAYDVGTPHVQKHTHTNRLFKRPFDVHAGARLSGGRALLARLAARVAAAAINNRSAD